MPRKILLPFGVVAAAVLIAAVLVGASVMTAGGAVLPLVGSEPHDHSTHDHGGPSADQGAVPSDISADEDPVSGHQHDELAGFEQYTEPGGVWPPRHTEIEDDRPQPTTTRRVKTANIGAYDGDAPNARQRSLARLLGERFERIESGEVLDAKGNILPGRVRTLYFSYSNNETVELVEKANKVIGLTRVESETRQPPRTEAEQKRAVKIAREHFLANSGPRVGELKGFAILGLPDPDNAIPDPGTPFFEDRILYVSFHVDALSDPEYLAWVDLTNNRIVLAEEA